jgi:hypothetical protein
MPGPRAGPGARRHRGQRDWVKIPADARVAEVPELPGDQSDWFEATCKWWKQVWESPVATMYQPADLRGLVRLARLHDLEEAGDLPASAYGEITKLEDRFGLNPKALNALGWVVVEVKPKAEAQAKPTRSASKPRRGLRAVDGEATG